MTNVNERTVAVMEFTSFNEAWEAATETRESFDYYQGMERKIGHIKAAQRWFVDMENKTLYYSYVINDGLRIVTEASPVSSLSDRPFQYIQLMKGKLRFSGQYVDRKNAIALSAQSTCFAFDKC